jgi:hypothetical protein
MREDEEWIEKFRAAVSGTQPPRGRRIAAAVGRLLGKVSNKVKPSRPQTQPSRPPASASAESALKKEQGKTDSNAA